MGLALVVFRFATKGEKREAVEMEFSVFLLVSLGGLFLCLYSMRPGQLQDCGALVGADSVDVESWAGVLLWMDGFALRSPSVDS